MINSEDGLNGVIKSYDPRILQTVRSLKSKPVTSSDPLESNKSQEEKEKIIHSP